MTDSPPPTFDAWSESEPPEKPQGRSSRTTGMMLIGGVFAMIVCMLGLIIGWNFGIMRPRAAQIQAEATQTYEAATAIAIETATARAQNLWEDLASTAQAQAGVMPRPEWRLRLNEPFERSSGSYDEYTITEGFDRVFESEIRGDKFFMHITDGSLDAIWAKEITKISDLDHGLIMIDAERVVGDENAEYGIGFRKSESGYYFFSVSPEGWTLYRVGLPDETRRALRTDQNLPDNEPVKHLAVLMNGAELDLYVNGTIVGSYSDTTFDEATRHSMALVVCVQGNGFSRISFDNLLIFTP